MRLGQDVKRGGHCGWARMSRGVDSIAAVQVLGWLPGPVAGAEDFDDSQTQCPGVSWVVQNMRHVLDHPGYPVFWAVLKVSDSLQPC